jgi:hypothetical protein
MSNTAHQIDTNATVLVATTYAIGETLFVKVGPKRGEPAYVEAIGVRNHVFLQHANGQRRWVSRGTLEVKYRKATGADVIPTWQAKGAIPAEPDHNPLFQDAPEKPGLRKAPKPAGNDSLPAAPPFTPGSTTGETPAFVPQNGPVEPSSPPGGPSGAPAPSLAPKVPAVIDVEVIDEQASDSTAAEAPEGMALVTRDGLSLAVPQSGEGGPKVQDTTLAEFIGLAQPRNFRQAVKKHESAGDLGPVDWRTQRVRQLTNGGGVREFDVTSAWLDRAQALYMIVKSNTPRANEMTRRVIDVFLEVEAGRKVAPLAPNPALDLMREQMAMMAQTQQTITQTMAMLAAVVQGVSRSAEPVDPKAQEALREKEEKQRQEEKRNREQGEFQALLPDLKAVFRPLLTEFIGAMLEVVDIQQKENRSRCLTSGRIEELFKDWLRARKAKDLPDRRVTYSLLKDMTEGVRIEGKKKLVILPFALKATA